MVFGEPLAHTPHKFKNKEMKAGGDYMPKVVYELQSLVQKTGRPTSLLHDATENRLLLTSEFSGYCRASYFLDFISMSCHDYKQSEPVNQTESGHTR